MRELINKLGGRKFVLTVLFMVVFCLNYALKWGMDWQGLLALAGAVGIYNYSNAKEGAAYAEADAGVALAAMYEQGKLDRAALVSTK